MRNRLVLALGVALTASGCASLSSPEPEPAVAGTAEPLQEFELPGAMLAAFEQSRAAAAGPGPAAEPAPAQPRDLWDRIRDGFRLEPRDDPRIERELSQYITHPEYITRTVERAEPYLHYIVEEVERRGLPLELALLPVIESGFQPYARSPAAAAGIWQFIPSTGSYFGLKQNWWYDGRRDVVASTGAALDYLERLYGRFGDWELALAAYNAGQGTVQRAVDANSRRGKPTDFWHLGLPAETRRYVPKLLAVKALIADPQHHGLALKSVPDEPYLAVVDAGSQIDLQLVAELTGLELEEIYRLNPGFNRWATDPDGPHLLLLPIDKAEALELALAELPEERRVRWARHKVASGETLSHIALRYNTTAAVIRQANGLRGSFLRAGQHLLVPLSRKTPVDTLIARSNPYPKAALNGRVHRVRAGDTLWDLARKYDVTPRDIARWNRISTSSTLRIGQVLRIAPGKGAAPDGRHYTVQRGDSLYLIARRFKVSIDDLRKWNNLPDEGYLQPGQRLLVGGI